MSKIYKLFIIVVAIFSIKNGAWAEVPSNELNIYSARKEEFLHDIFKLFYKQTNIKINHINDDSAKLIARIESEKNHPMADLLITADIGSIDYAQKSNLLEPMNCQIINDLESFFKDNNCYWAAISFRSRIIAYSKERINPQEITHYKDLADKKWMDKIILSPFTSPYNQFLVAYLIKLYGTDFAENWVKGLIANLLHNPSGSDTEKIKSIAAGHGELAIVNSYYYFRFLTSSDPEKQAIAEKVGIIFPNQDGLGAHINFSAVSIINKAQHKAAAEKFIEFLLSDEVQKILMDNNKEYSVRLNNNLLNDKIMPDIKFDMTTNLAEIAKFLPEALKIGEKKGWN